MAISFALALFIVSPLGAGVLARGEDPAIEVVTGLAPDVERLVAHTKPLDWETRRACLYYAFAGQRLLARRGIAASLWVGAVVYGPETSAAYRIRPHVWLETATTFIDFSTLPRWGQVMVVPRERVAYEQHDVIPGVTRALALRSTTGPDLLGHLIAHRARFERMLRRGEGGGP